MRAICPASFIYILLFTLIIVIGNYKLKRHSLCIFPSVLHHSPPWGLPFSQFYSPRGPRTPLWGFSITIGYITLGRTPQDAWSAVAETYTFQHTTLQTDIHAAGGIRTCNPNKRAAVYPYPRPRGHWDRLGFICSLQLTSQYQSVQGVNPPKNSARYKIFPNSGYCNKDWGQRLTFTALQVYCVQMQCVFKFHWITTEMFTESVVWYQGVVFSQPATQLCPQSYRSFDRRPEISSDLDAKFVANTHTHTISFVRRHALISQQKQPFYIIFSIFEVTGYYNLTLWPWKWTFK